VKAADVEAYDPNRFDFVWNEDFSEAQVVPLRWHDDASYIAYQTGDPFGEGA
jgi:hypothetical protein